MVTNFPKLLADIVIKQFNDTVIKPAETKVKTRSASLTRMTH